MRISDWSSDVCSSDLCLVFNDTRVIPAQLEGRRGVRPDGEQSAPGAKIGATLHKRVDLRRWHAFVRNAKRLRVGETVDFGAGVAAVAEERLADGDRKSTRLNSSH